MNKIKITPIKKRVGSGSIAGTPSKVHYNGRSNSVRVAVAPDGGLKAGESVYQAKLDNGIVLIIPVPVWKEIVAGTNEYFYIDNPEKVSSEG